MNEGHLGKFSFGGERAATDDHPVILHYLPLDASATSKIEVGTLLKGAEVPGATATIGASNSGVTAATVNAATFAAKAGATTGNFEFSYDGTDWKLSAATATLTEYGIELTGSPASGDTVTVALSIADVVYSPLLSTDEAEPVAVVDLPCDPTGNKGEKSVCAVVHGTVKTRLLKTGDGKVPTGGQITALARHGVFAV